MSDLASSLSIRPVTTDDLDAILAIEEKVHPAPWTRSGFEAELEKPYSRTWVLTDDETDSNVFAYTTFWVLEDSIEILNVAVSIESQGLGFAKKIMQSIIREGLAHGAKRLILDVRKSNLPAVGLYQKVGFAITQYRKAFYSNGEDAYHMSLSLEGAAFEF